MLLDGASRAEVQSFAPGVASVWNVTGTSPVANEAEPKQKRDRESYVPWDGMIKPGTTVKVSFALSSATAHPEGTKPYIFRATLDVDGKKVIVESPQFTRSGDIKT
jgi:hypothetical protein